MVVCYSVLQCVVKCCSVLQCVAMSALFSVYHQLGPAMPGFYRDDSQMLVCCRVLQSVAVCCSVLQCVTVCCSVYIVLCVPSTWTHDTGVL